MKRILSGVQATGKLHIGNYLGAIKPWAEMQHDGEALYFIPDLHTLNTRPKPEELREATLSTVAWLLAAGIDPQRSTIFVQSKVSAHSELAIILENFVTMGELARMTQYKDKSAKRGAEGQVAGLFTYPTLMAADILLYDANEVPVGEDQKQHVEIARDIADRFNNLYGPTFTVPQPHIGQIGARVMNLQHPESKMSKSDVDQSGNIMLLDGADDIRSAIKRAMTDSGSKVEVAADKPALSNLLQIYAGFSGKSIKEVVASYSEAGYGKFKDELAELVVGALVPLQQRFHVIRQDETQLLKVIEEGSVQAAKLANAKLSEVKAKLGLIS
jgi:tryptophanyl-tRNA synthetase